MATSPANLDKPSANSSLIDELLTQRQAAWDAQRPVQTNWPDRERLLINRASDSETEKNTRSKVTDGHLSTLAFDRQARVAAQLPTGSIYCLNCEDDKPAALMNLVLNKYIWPNANSQMDALTKIRMTGVYASVYGACPVLVDYRVDDEYIGPDFWIVQPRNFYPQPGKNSVRDCDWVMISSLVSLSYLQALAKKDQKKTSWKLGALKDLIKQAKKGTMPQRDIDSSRKSAVENIRTAGRPFADKGPAARVELVTKYEKGKTGHWITFAPDFKEIGVLRDIANPHNNGRIPVVMRQAYPLVDSIWGLGDFERGISLQKAKDSIINLYLDGLKLAIFPPLKIDPNNVTMSTIRMESGARWLMKDLNAIQEFQSSPGALDTFQGTYQFLTTALMNQWGNNSQQISTNESGNPSLGRTPQAIAAQQQTEEAMVNWDRFQAERFIEDTVGLLINLLSENQEKPINFHLFDQEVEDAINQFGDKDDSGEQQPPSYVKVMGNTAKVTLAKSIIGNKEYKWIIDGSSTMKQDDESQQEVYNEIISTYLQGNPQVIDQLMQRDGLSFNFGAAMKGKVYSSGIQDPDSIITKANNDEMTPQPPQIDPNQLNSFQDPDIRQAAQQLFANPGVAQPGMTNGQ